MTARMALTNNTAVFTMSEAGVFSRDYQQRSGVCLPTGKSNSPGTDAPDHMWVAKPKCLETFWVN